MEHISIEEVEGAYFECRKNKRNKRSSVQYELNYEVNNLKLWQELNDMTYTVGKSLAFCVTRPKVREVFAADFRDRIVHHILMRKFGQAIDDEMIEDSYNCRNNKGTQYGIRRIFTHIEEVSCGYTKETWILKCDLRGFFMSIDKNILWDILEKVIRKNCDDDVGWWLWLWKLVVFNRPEENCNKVGDLSLWELLPDNKTLFKTGGRGLPIGNLSSQILANLLMSSFDKWILQYLGENGRYGRYVDDWIAVSNDKELLKKLRVDAAVWLKDNLALTMHPKKIYMQCAEKGVEFIGAWIKPGRTYIGNRTVSNAFECVRLYVANKMERSTFVKRMNSYMGFMIHHRSYAIRWRLWNAINDKDGICCVKMRKLKLLTKTAVLSNLIPTEN